MNFKWYRSRTAASAMDDLLRAFEYAEARAADLSPRTCSMTANSDDRACAPSPRRESIEDPGPPYGRGV